MMKKGKNILMSQMMPPELRTVAFLGSTARGIDNDTDEQNSGYQGPDISFQTIFG